MSFGFTGKQWKLIEHLVPNSFSLSCVGLTVLRLPTMSPPRTGSWSWSGQLSWPSRSPTPTPDSGVRRTNKLVILNKCLKIESCLWLVCLGFFFFLHLWFSRRFFCWSQSFGSYISTCKKFRTILICYLLLKLGLPEGNIHPLFKMCSWHLTGLKKAVNGWLSDQGAINGQFTWFIILQSLELSFHSVLRRQNSRDELLCRGFYTEGYRACCSHPWINEGYSLPPSRWMDAGAEQKGQDAWRRVSTHIIINGGRH